MDTQLDSRYSHDYFDPRKPDFGFGVGKQTHFEWAEFQPPLMSLDADDYPTLDDYFS